MEGFLAMLDPAPLFPEDGLSEFYDGQPRDERGRFTFGRMAGQVIRCPAMKIPQAFRTSDKYDDILSMLKDRHSLEREWGHPGTGKFLVSNTGLRHAVRTWPSKAKYAALWNLREIINGIGEFHEEEPHVGKKGILKEYVGSTSASIGRHVYRVTVTIEQAVDGVKRFHHLRLDKEKASMRQQGG